MARYRNRPKNCRHLTCQGGECGKCCYLPGTGYPVIHLDQFVAARVRAEHGKAYPWDAIDDQVHFWQTRYNKAHPRMIFGLIGPRL
jgi:hypothetical protein